MCWSVHAYAVYNQFTCMHFLHSSGVPKCVTNVSAASAGCGVINVTWELATPPPVTGTVIHYGPALTPNTTFYTTCKGNYCSIGLMSPNTSYLFEVFPVNWCGRATGCVGNTVNSTTGGLVLVTHTQYCPI